MRFRSLQEFITAAAAVGEVKEVHGADLGRDVGCLTELSGEMQGPMLLFDRFDGFAPDRRIATNVYRTSLRRYALALGLPLDLHPVALVQTLREQRHLQRPVPPMYVDDGPVLENVLTGANVDVEAFPAPLWHADDGGRYIGTGDLIVMRDPDTGWINFGSYRAAVKGPDRLSIWIIKYKRGRIIAEKYWARGEACPVAVVLGCDPVTFMAGTSQGKYDYAGALHGSPVEVLRAPLTGLPIPAHAELVIEGEIPPPAEETVFEGPFGEWPGYYSHSGAECVVRVKQIVHRDAPVINGAPPLRPLLSWGDDMANGAVSTWDHLERSGVTDVVGVWGLCHDLLTVIAIKQRYPGHAEQALVTANGRISGGMYGTVVVVDDDVDPSNMREVLWALCTRVDPVRAVQFVQNMVTSDLDPRLSPERKAQGDLTMSRMLINACKPFGWKDQFPKTNIWAEADRRDVMARWQGLLDQLESAASTRQRALVGAGSLRGGAE
jgi:UbiD family decarboxylase